MLQAFKHGITLSNILKHHTIISNSSLFSYSLIYIREIFFLFITDFIKHPQTSYNCFKLVPFFVFFDLYSRDFFSFYNRLYQTSSNIIQLLQTRPFFRILWSILHIRENFFFLQETNFIKHPQTSYNCFKFIFFFSIPDPFPTFERILSITGARQEGLVVLN